MFGSGAGEELASEIGLPFLGHIGLRKEYRDSSRPTVLANKDVRKEYDRIVAAMLPSLEALGHPVT